MKTLGEWPYKHTETLYLLGKTSSPMFYFLDEDRIIKEDEMNNLKSKGYIVDKEMYTVASEELQLYIDRFEKQIFGPEIPSSISSLLAKNKNPQYEKSLQSLQSSAAILVISEMDKDIVQDIGGMWNSSLGVWILDAVALRSLREKKRSKLGEKIQMVQDRTGVLVEIHGDVTSHIHLIKSVGGKYNEEKDIWYVKMGVVHKILHIFSD